MGIAQAGLAFRIQGPNKDVRGLISRLFDQEATEIPRPDRGKFDIRNHSEVMVQVFGDVCFICNNDLVWNVLERPQEDTKRLFLLLGSPEFMLAFCHYDSGGSYGYTVIERGVRTRSRLQTTDVPRLPPLIEYGEPKAFEVSWLSASYYLEEDDCPPEERVKIYYQGNREILVAEHSLTARMLFDALESFFGVCPWRTDVVPIYRFFQLGPKKRPWWRIRR